MDDITTSEPQQASCVKVELCEWNERKIFFILKNIGISKEFACSSQAFLQVVRNENVILSAPLSYTDVKEGIWAGALDCKSICDAFNENSCTTLTMNLLLRNDDKSLITPNLNRKHQHKSSFRQFVSGFHINGPVLLLPDESKSADYVLRAIGDKSDASKQPYAIRKRNRPYKNQILLESLSEEPGAAHHIALSFLGEDNALTVSIDEAGDAWAVLGGTQPRRYCIADANDLGNTTLLDEGKPVENCTKGFWRAEEHEILLKPILEFGEICKQREIEYMAGFGTLLGAVRHKGIIPWDHDVDLFMTQDNYMKLRKLFDSGKMPRNLRLDDWMSIPGYPGPLGRLIDTSSVKLNVKNAYGHAGIGSFGIAFDIFPLIPVAGTKEDAERLRARAIAFWELENRVARSKLIRTDAVFSEFMTLTQRYKEEGRDAVAQELRSEIYSTSDDDADFYIVGVSGQRNSYIFKKDWIHPLVELPFDGRSIPCPNGYLNVLRELYGGNFRQYPSGKERVPKRYGHLRSFDLPFKVVSKTYLSEADTTAELQHRSDLKDLLMREAIERSYETKNVVSIKTRLFCTQMEPIYDSLDLSLRSEGDYSAIDSAYKSFFAFQLRGAAATWRVPVKIESRHLAIALEDLLCYRGESGTASQILSMRFDNTDNPDEEVSEDLQLIYDAVSTTVEMRDCLDLDQFERADLLAKKTLESFPFAVEALCARALISALRDDDPGNLEKTFDMLESESKRSKSPYPLIAHAILQFKTKTPDQAVAFAKWIIRSCGDGMAIDHLNDLMREVHE